MQCQQLVIEGLPLLWTAYVSEAGRISFSHIESGHSQLEVPPTFNERSRGYYQANGFDESDGGFDIYTASYTILYSVLCIVRDARILVKRS
jgi:hypothetical protein